MVHQAHIRRNAATAIQVVCSCGEWRTAFVYATEDAALKDHQEHVKKVRKKES